MRALVALLLLAALPARAQADLDEPLSEAEIAAYVDSLNASFDWQHGEVVLDGGIATLQVPETYRFIGPDDAERVLTSWGNPPGTGALGMLFPADQGPFDDTAWGVVITFQEDGFVSDEDAADIDYGDLLDQMKDDTEAENDFRAEQGYEPVDLLGWAEPPRYDPQTKKLFWAKELQFEGAPGTTLNYDVRLLGRRGVLSFNAVAAGEQLPDVRAGMQEVMAFSNFNEGHRYADFNPEVDNVAAYGIGALIAGKVAAKAGFFKLLLVFFAKGWKLVLIGAGAVAASLKRFLRRGENVAA